MSVFEDKPCPFCGGKLIYTPMDTETKQPEIIQCLGDCGMEMINEDWKKGIMIYMFLRYKEEDNGNGKDAN